MICDGDGKDGSVKDRVNTPVHLSELAVNGGDQLSSATGNDAASYLERFNIEMGDGSAPHYIINLNVYNTDTFNSSEDTNIEMSINASSADPEPSTSAYNNPSSVDLDKPQPTSYIPQPYLKPMSLPRYRGRGRGRSNAIPIDDVVEQKIRTFEGRDCVQHLDQLQQLFPRFKRAYINRAFTRNMLSFERTFQQLNEENLLEMDKHANVRMVQSSKQDGKRDLKVTNRSGISPLNPQSLLYLGVPLGRCPPHIASTLYRRVIVNPDGTVESADEHERRFMASNGIVGREIPCVSIQKTPSPITTKPYASSVANRPASDRTPKSSDKTQPSSSTSSVSAIPQKTTAIARTQEQTPLMQEASTTPQSGNRFFRTNRLSETENKKRGYVHRELRNAKSASTSAVRRNQNIALKPDPEPEPPSEGKDNGAVKYMASVGVVSTPYTRKQPPKTKKAVEQQKRCEFNATALNVESLADDDDDDGLNITNEERSNILAFFNEALSEELALMPGCSRKTAHMLISMRPFRNMKFLITQLSETRFLSRNFIDGCKEILQMRSTVIRLLQRCERITNRVQTHAAKLLKNTVRLSDIAEIPLVESPRAEGGTDISEDSSSRLITQQPAILNPLRELKPYQMVGLNWLRLLHHEKVNGILADEMGLGKTIQAIAFLASLWENGDRGPHLIICPSSTQDNWLRELSDWCSHLKVLVYQGSADQRKAMRLKIYEAGANPEFNVLLTSYATGTSTLEDRALMKRINFHYGIFDEAHMLKNMTSQRYRHLANFRVQHRLLLTGTPVQNNLLELISLLSFVMPEMFMYTTDLLKRMFQICSKPIQTHTDENDCGTTADVQSTSSFEADRLEQAKNLLHPFLLRRLKSQVLNQLPPKTSEIIRVPMTERQHTRYWSLVEKFRQIKCRTMEEKSDEIDSSGLDNLPVECSQEISSPKQARMELSSSGNPADCEILPKPQPVEDSPSNMITQLRKAANHECFLSGITYTTELLHEIAECLHLDSSHSKADPELIYLDLCFLSDHQVHKICSNYEALSSYTLSMDTILHGSGKIAWLDENIPKLIEAGHRILIFSQFLLVLDVLEEFLHSRNRRFLRLDGNTPVSERQTLIDRFNSSSIEVFLLSTRAGGLGINLTGADTVIIHDIDFNPYNDRQAEDRSHRLGQSKPVHVIRLISEGTVEEGMLRIATEKLQREQSVTGAVQPEELEDCIMSTDTNSMGDITENDNLTLHVLNSLGHTNSKLVANGNQNIIRGSSSTNLKSQINERDVWSLLGDALKPSSH